VPIIVTATAAAILSACKGQDMLLTRAPVVATIERSVKPMETTLFLAVPVNVETLKAAAEAAIGDKIAKWRAYIDDLVCMKRKNPWVECNGAVVTAEIERAGGIGVAHDAGKLHLTVPLKYDVSAKGHGWASDHTDTKSGTTEVRIPIDAVLGPGYRLDVRVTGEPQWAEKTVPILKGKVLLSQSANAKLKSDLTAAADNLRKAIAEQPIKAETGRAWRALHTPLALARGPDLWMKTEPTRIVGGGFAMEGSGLVYRIGVTARVAVVTGQRPMPHPLKPLPDPVRQAEASSETRLVFPITFNTTLLLEVLRNTFPVGEIIETRADNKSMPVKVATKGVSLVPSRDQLAVAMTFDIVEPRRFQGFNGRAFFLTRPVYDPATGILALTEPAFLAAQAGETKPSKPDTVRIGEEPFAGRIISAGRVIIGEQLKEFLPRINASVEQAIDESITLTGRFDAMKVVSVDPARDAFRVDVELSGALLLKSLGPPVRSGELQSTGAIGRTPTITK
jgi:hypothetical protein